jgi:hypothetical protein
MGVIEKLKSRIGEVIERAASALFGDVSTDTIPRRAFHDGERVLTYIEQRNFNPLEVLAFQEQFSALELWATTYWIPTAAAPGDTPERNEVISFRLMRTDKNDYMIGGVSVPKRHEKDLAELVDMNNLIGLLLQNYEKIDETSDRKDAFRKLSDGLNRLIEKYQFAGHHDPDNDFLDQNFKDALDKAQKFAVRLALDNIYRIMRYPSAVGGKGPTFELYVTEKHIPAVYLSLGWMSLKDFTMGISTREDHQRKKETRENMSLPKRVEDMAYFTLQSITDSRRRKGLPDIAYKLSQRFSERSYIGQGEILMLAQPEAGTYKLDAGKEPFSFDDPAAPAVDANHSLRITMRKTDDPLVYDVHGVYYNEVKGQLFEHRCQVKIGEPPSPSK